MTDAALRPAPLPDAPPAPSPDRPPRATAREWIAFAALAFPLLLVSMDVAVLYFAAPFISRDLHASAAQQLWIFDIYGFVLAGLLLPFGALADRHGRRRALLAGAALFGLASLAAALAPTAAALIAARAVLGAAGAALMPSTLGLVRDLFRDDRDRTLAVGLWSGVLAGGVALGPVLSGALLQHFAWGSVFLVNVPAMLLLLVAAPLLLPDPAPRREARVDLPSAVLSLSAVLPAVYAVKTWSLGHTGLPVVLALAVGVASAALFVARQRRLAHPLVDLRLLAGPVTGPALLASLVAMLAVIGNSLYCTQELQLVLGLAPLTAALWSLLPSVVVGAAGAAAPALAARLGRGPVMAGGFAVAAGGFLLLTALRAHPSLALLLVSSGLVAGGLVPVLANVTDVILGAAPADRASAASALSESVSELGGSLGVALLGSLGALAYRGAVPAALPDHLPDAVRLAALDSLNGALSAAPALPHDTALRVVAAARDAFGASLSWVGVGAAALMLLAAVFTAVRLRGAR